MTVDRVKLKKGVITRNLSNVETISDVTAKGAEKFAYVSHEETRLELDEKPWTLSRGMPK